MTIEINSDKMIILKKEKPLYYRLAAMAQTWSSIVKNKAAATSIVATAVIWDTVGYKKPFGPHEQIGG